MKAAFLSFAFGEYSIRLASALAKDIEIGLWLTDSQASPHLDKLDPSVRFRPFPKPRMRQPIRQVKSIRRLLRELHEYDPEVLHVQQGYLWFNPAIPLLADLPIVITVHDPKPHVGDRLGWKTPPFVSDFGFRRATRLIAHNEQMKQVLVDRGFGPDRIDVVATVVRGDADTEVSLQEEEGNLILFFGRIWEYKGLEYLIRAEPLIADQLSDFKIVIAGQGEDFSRYEKMMTNRDRFIVHNEFVSEEKKTELFARASVVVLPYIDATQSAVIATAYNFAKPVVATTVGGLPAMIDDEVTGLLVEPRDEVALAAAVVRLMKDAGLRHRMGAAARLKAQNEYAASVVAEGTLEVYRRAVG